MGKSVSQEISIFAKLKDMIKTDAKVYYILFKYSPDLLDKDIKNFKELVSTYKCFTEGMKTETHCQKWLTEKNVQTAIKFLLDRLHQQKMIELYNLYFIKAKDDTQAFKAFIEFSDKFFANGKSESELLNILQSVEIDEE